MKIKKHIVEKKVLEFFEEIELGSGVSVEKITTQTYTDNELVSENSESHYKNNKVEHGKIILFDKGVRELHRQYNIYHIRDEKLKDEIFKYECNPFDLIVSLGEDVFNRVELLIDKWYDHTLRTLDDVELPRMVYFDYMNGITDGNYDLDKLLKHIKGIESIEVLSGVINVPCYNRSKGCSEQIEFRAKPTQKEWDRILKCEVPSRLLDSEVIKTKISKYYGFDDFRIEFNYDENDDNDDY